MKLSNLIQLVNNLNQEISLCLKVKGQILPLTKISVTADSCLLFAGQRAMTKQQFFRLIKKIHHRNVTIWIMNHQEKIPVFGVQVSIQKGQAILM